MAQGIVPGLPGGVTGGLTGGLPASGCPVDAALGALELHAGTKANANANH
jgi:hypothetical protein